MFRAAQRIEAIPENHVGIAFIHVHESAAPRERRLQFFDQQFLFRQIFFRRHNRNEILSVDLPRHKMTDQTLFRAFVIPFCPRTSKILFKHGDQFCRPFGMDITTIDRNDTVTSFSIKAEYRISVTVHAHGKLQFIPVPIGRSTGYNGRNFRLCPADFQQGILHFFSFKLRLQSITHMLQSATAARVKNGAYGRYAIGRRNENFFNLSVSDFSLNFQNAERNFFPGQRIRHKKNVIFHPQHALAVASERLHRSRKNIVFLNHMFTRPPRSSRRYPLLYGYFRLIYLDMITLAFFLRRNISAS